MEENIKLLAKNAKERLKTLQYAQKNTHYVIKNRTALDIDFITAENKRMLIEKDTYENEEQRLWQKVCDIMESGNEFMSPISKLIDEKKYCELDERGKQLYVLKLTDKFRELKARYIKEREYFAKCN